MRLTPNTATPEAIINDITAVIPAGDMPAFIGLDYAEYTALRSLANLLPAIGKA
jgi:hypothetical protein